MPPAAKKKPKRLKVPVKPAKKQTKRLAARKTKKARARAPHPGKRPGGRPSSLTKKVHDRIIGALRVGAYVKTAAAAAGVSQRVVDKWKEAGRLALYDAGFGVDPDSIDIIPEDAHEHPGIPEERRAHVRFFLEVTRAREAGIVSLLASAHKAAIGGPVYDQNGNVVSTLDPDPKVGLKLVAMVAPEYAERRRHEHSGPGGEKLTFNLDWPDERPDTSERPEPAD